MGNPITLVKLLIKEADSNEFCIKCGSREKGLFSFVVYIYYTDSFSGEEMITGWSFPLCQNHISEEMVKYPADKPVLTQECYPDPKENILSTTKPPSFSPYFGPHAE